MYYQDLTPYEYTTVRLPGDAPSLVNFGWLDSEHDYPQGQVPDWLSVCLLRLAKAYANGTRGFHRCPFCQDKGHLSMMVDGEPVYLGSAEIRVRSGDTTFVAPSLVPHYIAAHGYRPPPAVLAALKENCEVSEADRSQD